LGSAISSNAKREKGKKNPSLQPYLRIPTWQKVLVLQEQPATPFLAAFDCRGLFLGLTRKASRQDIPLKVFAHVDAKYLQKRFVGMKMV